MIGSRRLSILRLRDAAYPRKPRFEVTWYLDPAADRGVAFGLQYKREGEMRKEDCATFASSLLHPLSTPITVQWATLLLRTARA